MDQIDRLVYELYDLTPEEIAIVENNDTYIIAEDRHASGQPSEGSTG